MLRINLNNLDEDYTEGGTVLLVLDGKPFTGIAYEMSSQDTLWSEQCYEEGILSGLSRDWYLNGQLRSQTDYRWNRVHGHDREWFENGQLKSDAIVELGIAIRKQEWDEEGNLIKDYHIKDDTWISNHLESQRELFRKLGVFYQLVL